MDLIDRQAILKHIEKIRQGALMMDDLHRQSIIMNGMLLCEEAVRNQPSVQPEPCEDMVSRQRLLSDLKELVAAWKKYPVMAEQIKGVEAAIGYVEAIPSAQPEIIRCKDCKFIGTDATCCLVCNREGMGLRPYHVYHDDFCSYAERRTDE